MAPKGAQHGQKKEGTVLEQSRKRCLPCWHFVVGNWHGKGGRWRLALECMNRDKEALKKKDHRMVQVIDSQKGPRALL